MTKTVSINRKKSQKKHDPWLEETRKRLASIYEKFSRLIFTNRVRLLKKLTETLAPGALVEGEPLMKEVRDEFQKVFDHLTEIHIKLTAQEVAEKYGLQFPATEADFHRICEAENIFVINTDEEFARDQKNPRKMNFGYTVRMRDSNETLITYSDHLAGDALVRQQFHLLGYYFLHHRQPEKTAKTPEVLSDILDARNEEAAQFADALVGKKLTTADVTDEICRHLKPHRAKIAA